MEKLPLTTRQREILEYMGSFTRESGYPPTVREICSATGLRSPRSVSQHLQSLERKGYIQRGRDKSRAIRFLERPDSLGTAGADAVVTLPVRGRVAAGPATLPNDVEGTSYLVDRTLFAGADDFLMRVDGDCMADAHILNGDYIVVNPGPGVHTGDIVVARVGSEVAVKCYELRGDGAFLVSQTGWVPVDGPQVEIVGRVVGLIRPR
jgi:repressor LexA